MRSRTSSHDADVDVSLAGAAVSANTAAVSAVGLAIFRDEGDGNRYDQQHKMCVVKSISCSNYPIRPASRVAVLTQGAGILRYAQTTATTAVEIVSSRYIYWMHMLAASIVFDGVRNSSHPEQYTRFVLSETRRSTSRKPRGVPNAKPSILQVV